MIRKDKISRAEVMKHLEKDVSRAITNYLKPVDKIWQPADILPESDKEEFFDDLRLLQAKAKGLSYELMAVLIGDAITEEALPTYESWLSNIHDISDDRESPWNQWIRSWTSEENRHGEILNKYLYLSGRVNMRQMEISTQYLLADGFDIQTSHDPYRNFVYTSFQELATNLSHRRVAQFAKQSGDDLLGRICGHVAADEARHANAYKYFVKKIMPIDSSEMMLAFEDMMKKKIIMPAHFLREEGRERGSSFDHFSDVAQDIGVYTAGDYVDILKSLLQDWKVETISGLTEEAEKARDYLLNLPERLLKVASRRKAKSTTNARFSWIYGG
ncbi:MAG: acyl-ACP desaturase [Ferruginibacter sp.]